MRQLLHEALFVAFIKSIYCGVPPLMLPQRYFGYVSQQILANQCCKFLDYNHILILRGLNPGTLSFGANVLIPLNFPLYECSNIFKILEK